MDAPFLSESVVFKCRVRSRNISLLRKNYKDHLKTKHPDENTQDLTPFGQAKISSFFSPKPTTSPVPSANQLPLLEHHHPNDTGHVEQSLIDADTTGGKRRHSSGDSGYTDDPESAEISPKKMHLSKDEEENKLDLILSEVKALRSQVDKGCISVHKAENPVEKSETDTDDSDKSEVLKLLLSARSVEDLENLGFKYNGEDLVSCSVCEVSEGSNLSGVFSYEKVFVKNLSSKE